MVVCVSSWPCHDLVTFPVGTLCKFRPYPTVITNMTVKDVMANCFSLTNIPHSSPLIPSSWNNVIQWQPERDAFALKQLRRRGYSFHVRSTGAATYQLFQLCRWRRRRKATASKISYLLILSAAVTAMNSCCSSRCDSMQKSCPPGFIGV